MCAWQWLITAHVETRAVLWSHASRARRAHGYEDLHDGLDAVRVACVDEIGRSQGAFSAVYQSVEGGPLLRAGLRGWLPGGVLNASMVSLAFSMGVTGDSLGVTGGATAALLLLGMVSRPLGRSS